MDIVQRKKYDQIVRRINPVKFYTLIINDEVFNNTFRKCSNEMIEEYNLISNEVFNADDIEMLYKEAKENYPAASNEEIFDIMKKLNDSYLLKRKR